MPLPDVIGAVVDIRSGVPNAAEGATPLSPEGHDDSSATFARNTKRLTRIRSVLFDFLGMQLQTFRIATSARVLHREAPSVTNAQRF